MKFQSLGWVVAIGLAAGLFATGFQGPTQKSGTVDLAKVFNDSDFAKKQQESLRTYGEARSALLDFLEANRTATNDQATKLRALLLKTTLTDTEKTELEAMKKSIQDGDTIFKQLQTKTSPTPQEVTLLNDYNNRAQNTLSTLQRWQREFEDDIRTTKDKLRADTLEKVQKAVKQIGTTQGYTVIFSSEAAPFGANDITDAALKAMNAQK